MSNGISSGRARLLWALAFLPALVAFGRTATTRSESLPAPPSEAIARRIATRMASAEPMSRAAARRLFPGDSWSADDDFHNQERRLAHSLAAQYRVALHDVFAIVDADIRAGRVPGRQVNAAPCKPRPFYD
jgi:hypothetical protein